MKTKSEDEMLGEAAIFTIRLWVTVSALFPILAWLLGMTFSHDIGDYVYYLVITLALSFWFGIIYYAFASRLDIQ